MAIRRRKRAKSHDYRWDRRKKSTRRKRRTSKRKTSKRKLEVHVKVKHHY